MSKIISLIEVKAVFTLLAVQIWFHGYAKPALLIPAVLILAISWTRNKEGAERLGLRPSDFSRIKKQFLCLAGLVVSVFVLGFLANPGFYKTAVSLPAAMKIAGAYYVWALLQQLLLNGFFVNRLRPILGTRARTAAVAGILFSSLHFPNVSLMVVTLCGGFLCALFFLESDTSPKSRNLYVFALGHMLLALSIVYALPYDWHHGLRVGYLWYHAPHLH